MLLGKKFVGLVVFAAMLSLAGAATCLGQDKSRYLLAFHVFDRNTGATLPEATVELAYDSVKISGVARGKPVKLPVYTSGVRLGYRVLSEGYKEYRSYIDLWDLRVNEIPIGMELDPSAESQGIVPAAEGQDASNGRSYQIETAPSDEGGVNHAGLVGDVREKIYVSYNPMVFDPSHERIFKASITNALGRIPGVSLVPIGTKDASFGWNIAIEASMGIEEGSGGDMDTCSIDGILTLKRPGTGAVENQPLEPEVASNYSERRACTTAINRLVDQIGTRVDYLVEEMRRGRQ